jgi:hypothetical protein
MAADSNKTGYMFHELYMWHHPGDLHNTRRGVQPTPHWESAESKRRLNNLIHVSGLHDHLVTVAPRAATEEELLRCGAATSSSCSCWTAAAGGGKPQYPELPVDNIVYCTILCLNEVGACQSRNSCARQLRQLPLPPRTFTWHLRSKHCSQKLTRKAAMLCNSL